MGILKISKHSPPDDYDDELQVNFQRALERERSQRMVRSSYPYFWGGVLFSALILCLVGVLGYWVTVANQRNQALYAFFKLQVVDTASKPVSGAKILLKKQQIGLTNAKGEWRRFLKVKVEHPISFQIQKHTPEGLVSTSKTFDLSEFKHLPKDPEVFSQVVLDIKKSPATPMAQTPAPSIGAPLPIPAPVAELQTSTIPTPDDPKVSEKILNEQSLFSQVKFAVGESLSSLPMDVKKTLQLNTYVKRHLESLSLAQGLNINPAAPWVVTISHMSEVGLPEDNGGLIRVTSQWNGHSVEFLRNYTGLAEKTAAVILDGLRSHTPYPYLIKNEGGIWVGQQPAKTTFWQVYQTDRLIGDMGLSVPFKLFPEKRVFALETPQPLCAQSSCLMTLAATPAQPPRGDWQRFRLKILGLTDPHPAVFVSGIKADFKGDKTWEFWATDKANMILTIIEGQRIVLRKPFLPHKNGSVESLPSSSIGQKSL